MAKPDLDDGYLKMAHELLAAVMAAHTTQVARVVLFEVFSQIYGPAKLPMATLRPAEIARRTGLQPSNISAAITSLLDRGMLQREGLSSYRFAKDYESWTHNGEPVLTPQMASYVAHAPVLAMSHRFVKDAQTPKKCSTKPAKNRIGSHIKSKETDGTDAKADTDLICDPSPNRIGSNTPLPIREKREELQQQQQRRDEIAVPTVSNPEGPDSDLEPFEAPAPVPTPEPIDTRPPAVPGELRRPFRPDPVEFARISDWVISILGNDNPAAINIGYVRTQFPLDWIEAAILEALAVPGMKPEGVWRYASRCLAVWWDAGARPKPAPRLPRVFPPSGSTAPAVSLATAVHLKETAAMRASIAAKKAAAQRDTAS